MKIAIIFYFILMSLGLVGVLIGFNKCCNQLTPIINKEIQNHQIKDSIIINKLKK